MKQLTRWLISVSVVLGYGVLSFLIADKVTWPLFVALAGLIAVGGWIAWRWGDFSIRHVLLVGILVRIAVSWVPPSLSDDAYRYVWDGVVQHEGINPYQWTPEDEALAFLHEETMYSLLNSSSYYSVYPPASQALFWLGTLVYPFGGWETSYYLIKGLLLLLELGALLLLSRMTTARRLLLYAWNPLIVLSAAAQIHTESAFVFFLILTVYAAQHQKGGWAGFSVALAGWVKLYPFVLLPLIWRRYGRKAFLVSIGAIIIVALPYVGWFVIPNMLQSLDLYARYFEFNAGLYYGIKQVFFWITGDDWSKQIGPFFRNLFLLTLPIIFAIDWKNNWSLKSALVVTMGAFFLFSTTVHPWYLLGLLSLAILYERPLWHWLWLGICSLGTYLHYSEDTLFWYWLFVILGWSGWLGLVVVRHFPSWLNRIQRFRAHNKVSRLCPWLPFQDAKPLHVLDLGAGEGFVGEALQKRMGHHVTLVDVVDFNKSALPLLLFDGAHLPYPDRSFDVVILYFVLHHAKDPEAVLKEAWRVARLQVLIVESVYDHPRERWLLERLDRLANRIRSGGKMKVQEEHLYFRTVDAWTQLFETREMKMKVLKRWGWLIHKQAFFLLEKPLLQEK